MSATAKAVADAQEAAAAEAKQLLAAREVESAKQVANLTATIGPLDAELQRIKAVLEDARATAQRDAVAAQAQAKAEAEAATQANTVHVSTLHAKAKQAEQQAAEKAKDAAEQACATRVAEAEQLLVVESGRLAERGRAQAAEMEAAVEAARREATKEAATEAAAESAAALRKLVEQHKDSLRRVSALQEAAEAQVAASEAKSMISS